VVYHKNFFRPSRHPLDFLGFKMCQFLETQPNHIISLIDLHKHYDHNEVWTAQVNTFLSLTHSSLTQLPSQSLTHSLTQSFTQLLTHSVTHSITYSITHSFTHSLNHSLIPIYMTF